MKHVATGPGILSAIISVWIGSFACQAGILFAADTVASTPDTLQCITSLSTAHPLEYRSPTIPETIHQGFTGSGEIMHAILPWNWENNLLAVGLGAATLPLLLSKNEIQEEVGIGNGEDIRYASNNDFYTQFEVLGDLWTLPTVSGAFFLGGALGGSQREVETGVMLAQSILFTAAVTGLGQLVFAEARPHEGGEIKLFGDHGHSISGHTSLATSMVKPIDSQYLSIRGDEGRTTTTFKYLGKVALYTSPVMVGISRVRSNQHYVWNVLLGLAVGYSVGNVVVDIHRDAKSEGRIEPASWQLEPGAQGISLCLKW